MAQCSVNLMNQYLLEFDIFFEALALPSFVIFQAMFSLFTFLYIFVVIFVQQSLQDDVILDFESFSDNHYDVTTFQTSTTENPNSIIGNEDHKQLDSEINELVDQTTELMRMLLAMVVTVVIIRL